MAGCDVLYHDPAQAGRGPHAGWRPCPAHGQVWTDPDQVLRFVCATHRRQVVALHAAALADRIRWGRPACRSARARRRGERPWTCASSTATARPAGAASAQPDDQGRKRRFCFDACKQAAYRARKRTRIE